jgi:hypothetical protein
MDFEAISIFILKSVASAAITTIIGTLIKQYIERQSKKLLAIFYERVFCGKHDIPRDSWYRNKVQIELGMGKNVKTADSFSTAKLSLRNISGRQIKKPRLNLRLTIDQEKYFGIIQLLKTFGRDLVLTTQTVEKYNSGLRILTRTKRFTLSFFWPIIPTVPMKLKPPLLRGAWRYAIRNSM